ncbi:MAG: DUF2358 domain-containing protein [Leptolyngbyaceae cyanobacterium RU_5_1]|nr:DUF2358 domain-containing protein [Leptolyngbyaceae cyanobacterium RU_5_1]
MDIITALRDDYSRFPNDQTFSLYVEDVYFKDPVFEFRGRDRYQFMIRFIKTVFLNCKMDLHNIQQENNLIRSDWTLNWNSPLPWKPHIAVPGWSELTLNDQGLIASHIDHWHCSKSDVFKQHFTFKPRSARNL